MGNGRGMKANESKSFRRWSLAMVSLALLGGVIVSGAWQYCTAKPSESLPNVNYNDLYKSAIDVRLDESRTLNETAMAIAAALIGLLIARPGEVGVAFTDWPEFLMLIGAMGLLAASIFFHIAYSDTVFDSYFAGSRVPQVPPGMADVLGWDVDYLRQGQMLSLFGAGAISFLVLFSVSKLKT